MLSSGFYAIFLCIMQYKIYNNHTFIRQIAQNDVPVEYIYKDWDDSIDLKRVG